MKNTIPFPTYYLIQTHTTHSFQIIRCSCRDIAEKYGVVLFIDPCKELIERIQVQYQTQHDRKEFLV